MAGAIQILQDYQNKDILYIADESQGLIIVSIKNIESP
jgi:hypothetical protein